jgi:hypothetical protein
MKIIVVGRVVFGWFSSFFDFQMDSGYDEFFEFCDLRRVIDHYFCYFWSRIESVEILNSFVLVVGFRV